jgi:hypothetical protein
MKRSHTALLVVALIVLVSAIFIFIPISFAANNVTINYRNVTVHTYVNITNSKPDVLGVIIYDSSNSSINNITLSAGSMKSITCNASVRDWNGFNDIIHVNATLYYSLNQSTDPDDNNTHYTNSSCTLNTSTGAYNGVYSCVFNILYYANNGTWRCNVTAKDAYSNPNSTGSNSNTTYFYPVYALNVTDGIDYGNIAVEEYSYDRSANITNFGNMGINVNVEGYGVNRSDNLAMNCSISGSISVENERFSTTVGTPFGSKMPLSSASQTIPGLAMPKQTLSSTQIINATYWQLYIPPNPAGNCTGFIIFSAGTS